MTNEGIELEIYHYSDYNTLKGILPGRQHPNTLSEMKGVGGGSFLVSRSDPKVVADPELLRGRNICKMKVDGRVVGAFLFGDRESTIITAAERSELSYKIAGPGLKQLFDDARIEAFGGMKAASSDQRIFNFASEQGSWYNPSDWITPFVFDNVSKGSLYTVPEKWPAEAKSAQWIWGSARASTMPYGNCYFRYSVTLTEGKYAIYNAVDDGFVLYVDGEQIAKSSDKSTSWREASRVEVDLTAGPHTIAYRAFNINAPGYMGPAALAMALAKVNADGTEVIVGQSQAADWKVLPYPERAPGWSPGEILGDLMAEAGARGVLFPSMMTKTFTDTTDSNGVPWPEDTYMDWSFKVGDSLLSVVKKLEEATVDIWIDPDTFELNMVPTRGVDRTQFQFSGATATATPIEFKLGKHLRTASTQSKSKIKNNLLLKTTEGFVIMEDGTSVGKYGKIEGVLDTGVSAQLAEIIAVLTFNQRAQEEEGASYDLLTLEYVPFRDFNVGDWVWAPDEQGLKAKRRVMSISTEESDSGQTLYTIEFDTIFRDNEDRINGVLDKMGAGGIGSSSPNTSGSTPGVGEPIVIPPYVPGGNEVYQTPKAPTDLVVTSTGSWTPDGVSTISTATLNWTAVTQDIDNFPMIPPYYRIEAQLFKSGIPVGGPVDYGQVTTNTATLQPFNPGEVWEFKVAAGDGSNWGAWSTVASVTMVGPTTPLPAPSNYILATQNGALLITWGGALVGTWPPPPQFRYVFAQIRGYDTTTPPEEGWTDYYGGVLTKAGQIIITTPGLVGLDVEVRLFAVDGVGIVSAPSVSQHIVVKGVDLGDLDQQVNDAIQAAQDAADAAAGVANAAQTAANVAQGLAGDAQNTAELAQAAASAADAKAVAAQTSADGKNTVWYQTTAPTGTGHKVGDTWFDTDDGNRIYRWDGDSWEPAQFGTNAIANAAITNALIADATIQNAKIATLDAAKITTGILNAARIGAKSIGVEKLLVSSLENLIEDPSFEVPSRWVNMHALATIEAVSPRTGANSFKIAANTGEFEAGRMSGIFSVSEGEVYRVSGYVMRETAGASSGDAICLRVLYGSTESVVNTWQTGYIARTPAGTTTSWVKMEAYANGGTWTVPAGARFARIGIVSRANTAANLIYRLDDLEMFKMSTGELIVDGAITAAKITAGTITGDKIAAGTIATSKLLVTNLDNVIEDGSFEYSNVSGVAWSLASGVTIDTVNPRTGSRDLKITTTTAAFVAATSVGAFQVEAGQQYRVEAWVRLDSGVMTPPGITFRFAYGTTESSTPTAGPDIALTPEDTSTTYTLVSGVWEVPAGAKWARLAVISREVTAGKIYRVDDIGVYRMSTGELIVDGSITSEKVAADSIVGRHIQAGSIATPHLQAQAVTTEKIAAEAITAEQIAAGAIQTNHLSAGSIKTSHISSEVGSELNISNNNNIRLIVGPGGLIPNLQDGLDGTNAELTTMQQYYDFGPEGAVISKPGSVFATRIDNDSIDMLENGNVISYWNSGTLYVNQLVGERVTLGNHQIARLDASVDPTSTIIRFLGS